MIHTEQQINTLSRKLFNLFIEKNLVTRVDGRNVFEDSVGIRYAFSISTQYNAIECRQFYDDCDALVCLNLKQGKLFHIHRKHLQVGAVSRIKTNGMLARNATGHMMFAHQSFFNSPI
jgi:hypothetical protein